MPALPMSDQQSPTHYLRNGKAYSRPMAAITPSQAVTEKTRSQAQIAATKRALQIRLAKKQQKATAMAKRQASLQAAFKAKLAQIATRQTTVSAWQHRPSQNLQPTPVETFAQLWVDETTGEAVGLDDIERMEIEEIVKRANESSTKIVKIQRVYNEFLERAFWEKREEFRKKNAGEHIIMFHGTRRDNIIS